MRSFGCGGVGGGIGACMHAFAVNFNVIGLLYGELRCDDDDAAPDVVVAVVLHNSSMCRLAFSTDTRS